MENCFIVRLRCGHHLHCGLRHRLRHLSLHQNYQNCNCPSCSCPKSVIRWCCLGDCNRLKTFHHCYVHRLPMLPRALHYCC